MNYSFSIFIIILSVGFVNFINAQDYFKSGDEVIKVLKIKGKGLMPYGLKPGSSLSDVKSALGNTEIFGEDNSYITYTIYFSDDKLDFGDIRFGFNSTKLVETSFETYFIEQESSGKLFNLLKETLSKTYGSPSKEEEMLKWNYGKKNSKIAITLKEIDYEGDNGFVLEYLTK